MAELNVQKKDTNIWPWVIGLLLVVAALWFVFGRSDSVNTVSSTSADSTYQTQPGAPMSPNPGRP
jgi:hypothetical protein